MSLNNARISLFNYIQSNWNHTNIVFQGDTAGDDFVKTTSPWIYCYTQWTQNIVKSLNGPDKAYCVTPGILGIKLYSLVDDGQAALDILTDHIFSLFRSKDIDDISVSRIGINQDEVDEKWNIRLISARLLLQTIENI